MKLLTYLRSILTRSSRTFVWSATACGLLVLLGFFLVIGYDFYRSALRVSEQAAGNVATLAQQTIARDIELYDLSLQAVLDGVRDSNILYQEPTLRQKILFDRSATAPGLGAIVALDDQGNISLDSLGYPVRAGNFADRDYFKVHRDSARDIGLYVSEPFRARLQNDAWMLSVSRRINKPDGSFGGIVSGTIRVGYLEQLFNKVAIRDGDRIFLLKDDGTLLARAAGTKAEIGANWQSSPIFNLVMMRNRGAFVSDAAPDGLPRLYSFHRVHRLPLVVVVGITTDQILAPWRSKMMVLAAIFAVMALSVIGLVWMLESELLRRAAAEKAAEELARTDSLTGLSNRRRFDEILPLEWDSAAREGGPISLLMIDVDHFKLFNDSYGHQEGDRTLAAVAAVIDNAVRRPDDFAARYGGEEFVVLLPNTDRRGAAGIAETIREKTRSLLLNHSGTREGVVTVSIGVASAIPRSGHATVEHLIRDADTALYRAKEAGRNIVRVGNVLPADFERQAGRAR